MGTRGSRSRVVRRKRTLRDAVMAAILAAFVAAAGSPAVAAAGSPAVAGPVPLAALVSPPAPLDWETYGFTVGRSGWNPFESTINPRNVHRLHQVWSFRLGSDINTQPLFAAQVPVPVARTHALVPKDLVIAGSENGSLAAVDARTGRKIWLRHLG